MRFGHGVHGVHSAVVAPGLIARRGPASGDRMMPRAWTDIAEEVTRDVQVFGDDSLCRESSSAGGTAALRGRWNQEFQLASIRALGLRSKLSSGRGEGDVLAPAFQFVAKAAEKAVEFADVRIRPTGEDSVAVGLEATDKTVAQPHSILGHPEQAASAVRGVGTPDQQAPVEKFLDLLRHPGLLGLERGGEAAHGPLPGRVVAEVAEQDEQGIGEVAARQDTTGSGSVELGDDAAPDQDLLLFRSGRPHQRASRRKTQAARV